MVEALEKEVLDFRMQLRNQDMLMASQQEKIESEVECQFLYKISAAEQRSKELETLNADLNAQQ